ncbi:AcrR family transcriptional regulator [Pseudarthrobacter sp. W1I19]|uniref:TetR/AcrR family transcriptional regulator n=1 Tax=Pseudarthrobacter sp. W1I19 TaxID=3042288 RepID=UPI0027839D03|nr:TetR/AcrR family transcriptional regulator [Pseudarthrobacter sp. W1I19]MDQ0923856.1 AcrR family transcriptional regulator [Pseudarthrobacter sp. W1I19]
MDMRATILDKASELLSGSTSGDISTRAVCDAAGTSQPVLYRLFGDKEGLLSAVVDHVWDQYLSMKRTADRSGDPLDDLYRGWDSHVAFALDHPHAYRLLFGTSLSVPAEAGQEAMRLLQDNLERLAAQGRLTVAPEDAAKIVMAANSGIALSLLLRSDQYPEKQISTTMRDTVYRSLLVDAEVNREEQAPVIAATTIRSALAQPATEALFTRSEAALLSDWLKRIQDRRNSG